MFFKEKTAPTWLSWATTQGLFVVLSHVKVNYIWGSLAAYFSAPGLLMPLMGAFTGMGGIVFATIIRGVATGSSISSLHLLAYHIPGFCAALAWTYPTVIMRILVPLSCMALFWMHPVGYMAAPYALFWLIPVLFFYVKRHSLFSNALSISFIAHAVGSVIWLYTVPMNAQAWISLMPVVVIERVIQTIGLMCGYYIVYGVSSIMYYMYQILSHRYFVQSNQNMVR